MPPVVEVERHEVLDRASFALVEARIDWEDRSRSTGWGRDAAIETATDKAICEAVERHCHARLPATAFRASASTLDAWVEPTRLVRYATSQYETAGFGPKPFVRSEERLWLRASAVRGTERTHVPADFICSPMAFDAADRDRLVTHASTSGCASGFRLDDAILRASLESMERDAFMRHWFAQSPGDTIARVTLPARFRQRLQALEEAGCAAGIQCLSMGVQPTWLAWAQHPTLCFTSLGSATGLDAIAALDNAMNELETMALARVDGVPVETIAPANARRPADHAALYATPDYFRKADALWHGASVERSFDDASASFVTTAERLYDRADRAGHELYWVDLTPPEARAAMNGRTIHTARVLGTELIPMCFGYGQLPLGMDRWHRADPETLHPFA